MTYSSQLATYKIASETVQKTRQLVMLYDAVIRFLNQAKLAMEEKRFEDRLNLIQKGSNIIVGLHSALDFEKGGEISAMLNNFYSAIDLRMLNLNRSNSPEECEQIIREIKMMRDAWDQIDHQFAPPVLKPEMAAAAEKEKISADFSA